MVARAARRNPARAGGAPATGPGRGPACARARARRRSPRRRAPRRPRPAAPRPPAAQTAAPRPPAAQTATPAAARTCARPRRAPRPRPPRARRPQRRPPPRPRWRRCWRWASAGSASASARTCAGHARAFRCTAKGGAWRGSPPRSGAWRGCALNSGPYWTQTHSASHDARRAQGAGACARRCPPLLPRGGAGQRGGPAAGQQGDERVSGVCGRGRAREGSAPGKARVLARAAQAQPQSAGRAQR